jgi:hypothetical protein
MNNNQFLKTIASSFIRFLETSARSNKKLIILHGGIAEDIKNRLGEGYDIKSLGIGDGKEGKMKGRYMEKTVDILISKNGEDLAGIAVKFVMNNYFQNSNNYFENMLGETANIRTNGKKYFQIIILPKELPYYDNKGKITKWEKITEHNIDKYTILSRDNTETNLHIPTKTLLHIIKLPNCDHETVDTRSKYKKYYLGIKDSLSIEASNGISVSSGGTVILNDYELFIEKIVRSIKSI